MKPSELLWPRPQELDASGGICRLPTAPRIAVRSAWAGHADVVARLAAALVAAGFEPRREDAAAAEIVVAIDPAVVAHPEGYRLLVSGGRIELTGADAAGVRHAVTTLGQWLRLHTATVSGAGPRQLPALAVRDWPSLPVRGAMLDISRDRVPTMATLRQLIDLAADLKLNQLQLYVEHTFAYVGHEEVWQDASPLTADEVGELDARCRRRGIELVPNQNSLGHLHRWLRRDRYRLLAECPEGIAHPFGHQREPFSLCPTDAASLELLADLYDQLLPCFTSRQLNVGLDETFDIGKGRSAAAVAARGAGRVYLDFLLAVHRLVSARGHRLQFWGDIVLAHPELIAELPSDLTALAWGYEADHPFAEEAARFAGAGRDFVLCPGTSSWNSLGGRTENALRNLASAATAAGDAGARGLLITDWGDFGHLQPLAVSWGPLLAGAGWAWNVASAPAVDATLDLGQLAALMDAHVLHQGTTGLARAALDLGNVYRRTGTRNRNGSALFFLLAFPEQDLTHMRYRGLNAAGLAGARGVAEDVATRLAAMPVIAGEGETARDELLWAAELLALAAELGSERLAAGTQQPVGALPAPVRQRLGRALTGAIEQHRPLWLRRSRPGGRQDSVAQLHRLAAALADEPAVSFTPSSSNA